MQANALEQEAQVELVSFVAQMMTSSWLEGSSLSMRKWLLLECAQFNVTLCRYIRSDASELARWRLDNNCTLAESIRGCMGPLTVVLRPKTRLDGHFRSESRCVPGIDDDELDAIEFRCTSFWPLANAICAVLSSQHPRRLADTREELRGHFGHLYATTTIHLSG